MIGDPGAAALAGALFRNRGIRTCSHWLNPTSAASQKKINDILRRNKLKDLGI